MWTLLGFEARRCNYSANHDASALKETARWFKERYTDTAWAKRASIW